MRTKQSKNPQKYHRMQKPELSFLFDEKKNPRNVNRIRSFVISIILNFIVFTFWNYFISFKSIQFVPSCNGFSFSFSAQSYSFWSDETEKKIRLVFFILFFFLILILFRQFIVYDVRLKSFEPLGSQPLDQTKRMLL